MLRAFFVVFGLAVLIGQAAVAPAADPPKLDNYGDPLPAGAVLRLGTTRLQTGGSFAWTADGKSLVTMRGDHVYWWDMADGKLVEETSIPINDSYGTKLALSANNKTLVCAGLRGTLAVLDLATRKVVKKPREDTRNEQQAIALAIAPDGQTFATVDGETLEVRIWDSATCEVRRTVSLAGPLGPHRTPLVFSPDGKVLAVPSEKTIHVIPVEGGEPVEMGDLNGTGASYLMFTSDGKNMISVGGTKHERLFSPKGTPFIRNEPQLRAWKVSERRMLFELPVHAGPRDFYSASLAPDNRTLVTVHRDRIQVWDLSTRSVVRKIEPLHIRNPQTARVSVDPSGKLVAVRDDSSDYVRIWNLATGQPHLNTDQHHNDRIIRVAWSPDGAVIATGRQSVWLWDADTAKPLRELEVGQGGAWHLEFTPDSKRLLVGGDEYDSENFEYRGGLRTYEVASGKLLGKHDSATRVRRVALSPDGKRVAVVMRLGPDDPFTAGSQGVRVIDSDSGKMEVEFHLPSANVAAVKWADKGKKLSIVGEDATARQVDVEAAKVVSEFALPHPFPDPRTGMLVPGAIGEAALFRDGRNLISVGGKGDIYHWLVGTGVQQWSFPSGSPHIRALAVSPDARMFAGFCSDGDALPKKIRVWDVVARKLLMELDAGIEPADSMAFSPGGTRLVVGYYDGTALVYDVAEAVGKLE